MFVEGSGYQLTACTHVDQETKLGLGAGQWIFKHRSTQDYVYTDYNDYITMTRPTIVFKNIAFGTLYAEIEGSMEAKNHLTGERAEINFKSKGWNS